MNTYTVWYEQDRIGGRHRQASVEIEAKDAFDARSKFYEDHNDDFTIMAVELDGEEVE